MEEEVLNKLDSLKNKEDITVEDYNSTLLSLKNLLYNDNNKFNKLFKLFVDILKEKQLKREIYADFLYSLFYYKTYLNELNNYNEYKDFFIKAGAFKENELLDLDIYDKDLNTLVYAYHDGSPILQVLKINEDMYDMYYHMGKNNEKQIYYYKATITKELLDKFDKDEITLKEIYLSVENTVKCVQLGNRYYYYFIKEKDLKEIRKDISEKLTASFFTGIWGNVSVWEGVYLD